MKVSLKNVILSIFALLMVMLLITLIIGGADGLSPTSYSWVGLYIIMFAVLIPSQERKKKVMMQRIINKENKPMEKEILARLIDKEVTIHTMDEYISGVVSEVTDSTVIVKKMKSDGTVKRTCYIQNSVIMTIDEK